MVIQPGSFSNHQDSNAHSAHFLQTTFGIAIMVITLFLGFSPTMVSSNPKPLSSRWQTSQQKNGLILLATQGQNKSIALISGHWGNGNDLAVVCLDGTKEQVVNLTIATLVRQKLKAHGYRVDMLQEFDSRLEGYDGEVLLAIHTDSCNVINNQATGFKVATSTYIQGTNLPYRLTACLDSRYAKVTGLRFNPSVLPRI